MTLRTVLVAAISLASSGAFAQSVVTPGEILNSLVGGGQAVRAVGVDVVSIRRDIEQRIKIEGAGEENAASPPPALQAMMTLPNLTLVIEFDLDSDRIKPQSWPTVGRIADALHHPLTLGNRFVVVGHTDAKGDRMYNLGLSQRRADAVAEVLTTMFGIEPARILSLGLGEEQLRDPQKPDDGTNRRVQLLNIGPL
jgi:OmpA-OmpF porin, OOP family